MTAGSPAVRSVARLAWSPGRYFEPPAAPVVAGGASGVPYTFGLNYPHAVDGIAYTEAVPGTVEFANYIAAKATSDAQSDLGGGNAYIYTADGGGLPNGYEYEVPLPDMSAAIYAVIDFNMSAEEDPWTIRDSELSIKDGNGAVLTIRLLNDIVLTPAAAPLQALYYVDTAGYLYLAGRSQDALLPNVLDDYTWETALTRGAW